MKNIAPYGKAITGAVVAGLAALVTALDDNAVSSQEWTIVALGTVTALGAVWAVPNGKHSETSERL